MLQATEHLHGGDDGLPASPDPLLPQQSQLLGASADGSDEIAVQNDAAPPHKRARLEPHGELAVAAQPRPSLLKPTRRQTDQDVDLEPTPADYEEAGKILQGAIDAGQNFSDRVKEALQVSLNTGACLILVQCYASCRQCDAHVT